MESGPQALIQRLCTTRADLRWAVAQAPAEREARRPPPAPGDGSVRRHGYSLWFYEQAIALPQMQYVLGRRGSLRPPEVPDEEAAWPREVPATAWLERLGRVRAEALRRVEGAPAEAWFQPVAGTVWGTRSLAWIVAKTVQHTDEHP